MSTHQDSIDELKLRYPHRYNPTLIDPLAWVAPGAIVCGDVQVGKNSSIWFNCVLRGDVNYIRIGEGTNIQDLSMIHVSYKASPAIVGNFVTVGHCVLLHACTIRDYALIGMGSIVMDDAEVGEYSLIGAGSLVTQGTKIPPGSKAFGRPAKVVGKLTEEEKEKLRFSADHYMHLASTYRTKTK